MENKIKNPIYLDIDGYNQYLAEIEEIRNKLKRNGHQKSSAYVNAVGDGWHDNFEFEEATREEYKIMCELREKIAGLERSIIVEAKENQGTKIANINDLILVEMGMKGKQLKEELFKLVASSSPDIFAEISEVSINSPIGKTLYQQPEGFEGEYTVGNNTIAVKIKKIGQTLEEVQGKTKKLIKG